jgi:8-oxo-dGTP pyrophosphatase MutT (NUDIX family)
MPPAGIKLDNALRSQIEGHLQRFERRSEPIGEQTPAAVALALTNGDDGEASFIITRRASQLRNHAGQWALPGGRLDPGEDPRQAALRELEEEVGLQLTPQDILGELDDYTTRSGFHITPVIVWAGHDCTLVPDPTEVAAIYRVALEELEKPGVPRLRQIPESDRAVLSIPILEHQIHAPTAAILYQLREVALHGRATRVFHYEQPVFAWK